MTLATQLLADLDVLFDDQGFGRTVGYYPASGTPALIDGIVMQQKENEPAERRDVGVQRCELAVRRSEVATPSYRDRFEFDSRSWRLDVDRGDKGVVHRDSGMFILALERVV
jgi:hypothetical protein